MTVSIITVTFNDLRRLPTTVASIAEQKYRDFEHILVDGASVDGTFAWYQEVQRFARSTALSEPDSGIFDAMNKGLALAEGDAVIFMNAGDRFHSKHSLGYMVELLKDRDVQWGYGRADVVSSDGGRVRPTVGRVPYSRWRHWYGFATICHQAVIMRTDFMLRLGGFDHARFGAASDYHFLLLAAENARPVAATRVVASYEAGGVSEVDIYRQLWRRHRARSAVRSRFVTAMNALDFAWTGLQVAIVAVRRALKAILRQVGIKSFLGRRTDAIR